MRGMIYIYALSDPFTYEIRYIGKTVNINSRLASHCNDRESTYKCNWIRSVIAKGKKPAVIILETLSDSAYWQESEISWIAYALSLGWPLTNSTSGGEGVVDLCQESRDRITKAWIGRKHSAESILRIGQASKGRVKTEPMKQVMRDKMKGRTFTDGWLKKIAHSLNKLSDDQVREIRVHLSNKVSQYKLAEMYGVHQGTISNIKRGVSYADIL